VTLGYAVRSSARDGPAENQGAAPGPSLRAWLGVDGNQSTGQRALRDRPERDGVRASQGPGGLDELLTHLDALAEAVANDDGLHRVAFLVVRARADVETAIEATLSGFLAVTSHAMRDVMEIADLLRDFAVNPGLIDEWLTANARTRRSKFAAAAVRRRLHDAGEQPYVSSDGSAEYKAHSAALHVRPYIDLAAPRGCTEGGGWNGNVGFSEVFQHARDLLLALRRLSAALSPGSAVCDLAATPLPAFRAGLSRSYLSPTTMLMRVAAHKQREIGT
jgi:hypothetical protein